MQRDIGIPLETVLKIEAFAGVKVLAGASGLQRPVSTVNVMEVPDIVNWVKAGELLITTAHAIKDDVKILLNVIPRLAEIGVAGMGIKLKRYVDQLPPEVLSLADSLDFPIIELPPQTAFSDLITAVLTRITDKQTKMLLQIQNLHRALTSTMLSGGDLQEIVVILHRRFGNSVAISSGYFSSFVVGASEEKYQQVCRIMEQEKKRSPAPEALPPEGAAYRIVDSIAGETTTRIVMPISSDNIPYGNIYMWEDVREITGVEQAVIESATSLIALDMVKKASMLEMENSHKTGFLDDLLSGDRKRLQRAMVNAHYFSFDAKAAHQVAVIRLRGQNGGGLPAQGLYSLNNHISAVLQRLARQTPFKFVFASQLDNIVILCEAPACGQEMERRLLEEFLAALQQLLQQENLTDLVLVGVGRSYAQPNILYRSLAEARRATVCPPNGGWAFFEDAGVYRLLAYEGLRNELAIFQDDYLKPLLDYDREKDSELVKTLAAYFKCRGNLTRLAEHLNVHYNTIVYRMQRIRELSGFDLENERDLLNLQIALKIGEMKTHE